MPDAHKDHMLAPTNAAIAWGNPQRSMREQAGSSGESSGRGGTPPGMGGLVVVYRPSSGRRVAFIQRGAALQTMLRHACQERRPGSRPRTRGRGAANPHTSWPRPGSAGASHQRSLERVATRPPQSQLRVCCHGVKLSATFPQNEPGSPPPTELSINPRPRALYESLSL